MRSNKKVINKLKRMFEDNKYAFESSVSNSNYKLVSLGCGPACSCDPGGPAQCNCNDPSCQKCR
jgi:hypothetical protein